MYLDGAMGGAYPAPFVAALAEQLPQDCRWRRAYDKDAWWTGDRILAANLVNSLNALIYGLSDKKKRGSKPKPIGPSWAMRQGGRGLPATVMGRDVLIERLSRPRKTEG